MLHCLTDLRRQCLDELLELVGVGAGDLAGKVPNHLLQRRRDLRA